MNDKQSLVIELLRERLDSVKTGVIIKGIEDISPKDIILHLSETHAPIYAAVVGYGSVDESKDNIACEITASIEKAVLWRSNPEYAGHILVFIKTDTEKLHSLAEFDVITTRDVSRFLLELQLKNDNNTPTRNFWTALRDTSDYYTFNALYDFAAAISEAKEATSSIPQNMWRINLLSDSEILGTKNDPRERLERNRNLIFAIGQMSEDSRKKMSRSLARTKADDKDRLQAAYYKLQSFYKYGRREDLKELSLETVQELFSASQKKAKRDKTNSNQDGNTTNTGDNISDNSTPIRPKELDSLISDAIVFGEDEDLENIQELFDKLSKHYDPETEGNDDEIAPVGGIFGDRSIAIENHQNDDLRKLVGKFCNISAWGGLMETDESVLKDAISADITNAEFFRPEDAESIVAFSGGIDGSQSLFDFIIQFDAQFDEKGIETVEHFSPIIENLKLQREKLYSSIDMILYHPILLFGASEEKRQTLIDYIAAWENLYHAFCVNEPTMRQISAGGTSFIARAILLLDILYVKTPKEWKGILLPLHPIYLWRYYEVFRTLPGKKAILSDDDKDALSSVFSRLPQVLSFIIANSVVTESEDRVLPCSGSIEMLPTFENKTNRYLGNDGTEAVEEILTRWVGFAPYTRNEIRICTVDAPDLIGILRQVKSFMDKNSCKRVVYDVYLTRNQNGNTELSKLDYAGKDYEIGEYIKQDRISISIKNVQSSKDVKTALDFRPVHVAFYFDQSSYAIEYGPNSHNLYINPLVITYDYDFDEIQHRGSIFPSSDMDSGLIGDYHKMMRSADVISNNMNPRTTYNGSADMTAVVSTIEEGLTQWLVVADRDTNNYQPEKAIPIGEMQYDKRTVNVWASDESRIISQYLTLLRGYNLYPKAETLIDILRKFGHIASNGLISIPRFGADAQAIDNKKKGLIGTLFAASWYMKMHNNRNAMVASLDDDKARLWLQNRHFGNERADLVGLYYDEDKNTLHVQPIEVKTRDESPDAVISPDESNPKLFNIKGHAAEQVASVIEILKGIFMSDEYMTDMFTSARREVLKYQIVSECFRNIHDADWQKHWYDILKKAFTNGQGKGVNVVVSGLLVHIKLNEATGGEHIACHYPEFDDCQIDYWKLTAKEIQKDVLGDSSPVREIPVTDFDMTEEGDTEANDVEDAIVDIDIEEKSQRSEAPKVIPFPELSDSIDGLMVAEAKVEYGTKHKSTIGAVVDKKAGVEGVSSEEIEQLVRDFKRACGDYHVSLRECNAENTVVGPSVIRLKFRLGRGQALQGLSSHLEDIGREMKRTGVIIQQVPNSDELLLDVPRLKREQVLFRDVISSLPVVTSPEQLYFPLGRTPNGEDLIENLGEMPHMLVGGSTGSGKSVFLFTMLASLLMTHPNKEDMLLVLSSSKLEDFIHFEGLPHLYSGSIISDATEATKVIKDVIFEESERRGKLLAQARVANITEYNKVANEKLAPIVVVIDEFADLADQLETKKEQNAFYKPVQRIAQAGRSRGIHLVICTQRPEAKLVPATTKAQLNGRVALRVNDGISSRMIIESPDAQYLQKHGDMIYKNGDVVERAQGYLIEIPELDDIVQNVINWKN